MRPVVLLGALVPAACVSYLYAQGTPAPSAPSAPPAVQQCASCHGQQGEGNPTMNSPRIAGQSQAYLVKQLQSYAEGTRRNPVMEPIAKALSVEDRNAAAAHYARIAAPRAAAPAGQPAKAAQPAPSSQSSQSTQPPSDRGRTLAAVGDNERRLQACANCHGPGGIGEPPSYPYLAGLDAAYMVATINAWKSGTRQNDSGQQMATVARALTPEDIAAVSQYYASLAPPKPAPENIVRAPTAAPRPGTGGTPAVTQSTAPGGDRAVGADQGASTRGGSQGPGGTNETKRDSQR